MLQFSPTRGFFGSGFIQNTINQIEILLPTTGNGDFGDLVNRSNGGDGGFSNGHGGL